MMTWALLLALAKPPEPLEEIFPQTQLIVDAVVVEVTKEDPPDASGHARQSLILEVTRCVRGALPTESRTVPGVRPRLTVVNPTYRVKVGIHGPWLLHVDDKTGARTVLGRYGPDTWTLEQINAKLTALDPPQLR